MDTDKRLTRKDKKRTFSCLGDFFPLVYWVCVLSRALLLMMSIIKSKLASSSFARVILNKSKKTEAYTLF